MKRNRIIDISCFTGCGLVSFLLVYLEGNPWFVPLVFFITAAVRAVLVKTVGDNRRIET